MPPAPRAADDIAGGSTPPRAPPPRQRGIVWLTVEQLLLAASLWWAVAANRLFFAAALADRPAREPATWGYGLALAVVIVALHLLLMALVATRRTVKPLVAALIVGTAIASYFMQALGVYLDPSMLRNTLRTDAAESRELLSWAMLPHLLLHVALPLLLLWRVRIVPRPWRRALGVRLAVIALATGAALAATVAVYQPLASLMRNHKDVRYLVTPSNYLWSLGKLAADGVRGAAEPRRAIGLDAVPGPSWLTRKRPLVVVLVVGETARAANWGLDGYARQTTPRLAAEDGVTSFVDATSCGTDTEVSVPCLFAPVGRRHYDERRIRGSESLLHVLRRAGVAVQWRDNQSGCKGVCEGLPTETVASLGVPGLCQDGRCLDEGLLHGLDARLAQARGTQLLVLHQLGNHGPGYFRRYPAAFDRFRPACRHDDLQRCSREEIVNAYDNALLYTDHVLATAIDTLRAQADRVDSLLLYVSDHGESLGEHGLYLHGLPYAVAPREQTHVPMLLWASSGLVRSTGLDLACLRQRATRAAGHDNVFHTLLGVLDVRTALYEPALDLTGECRTPVRGASAPGS